jgi:glucosamine--fructose-6-phosphate aminotransferase (isomerizing)
MKQEIGQIPSVIEKQAKDGFKDYIEIGERLRACHGPLVTNARGTSDHAAAYFKSLVETKLGRVVTTLPPSVSSVYNSKLKLKEGAMLSISQSGGSPDLISSQTSAKAGGAFTVAVSNHPNSALATEADLSVEMFAGTEQAVAATKTFVASLIACNCIVQGMQGREEPDFIAPFVAALQTPISEECKIQSETIKQGQSVFTISRGLGFSVAQEAALKLKELCQIHAEAYSAAEVIHGPMVLARNGITIIAFETKDDGQKSIDDAIDQMESNGANIIRIPAHAAMLDDEFVPIVQITQFYSLIEELSISLGFDPDVPPMLKKATQTV